MKIRPWGICQRDGLRYPLDELVPEPRTGLLVHTSNYDDWHPQELPPKARTGDPKPLPNVSPEEPAEEVETPYP